MITLSPAHDELATLAVDRRGGFAWWYLDLVDARGEGLVLIWGFGLPFLPGIRDSEGPPRLRPSLTISLYREGRERFYLFQELPPDQAEWSPERGTWRFGRSEIRLQRALAGLTLHMELDVDVPGLPPLRGSVEVRGPVRIGGDEEEDEASREHVWAPLLAAAPGSVRLRGAVEATLNGRAYLDHNAGLKPLHALGIARWSWGRLALPGRELIWYHLSGDKGYTERVHVLEVRANGVARRAQAQVSLDEPRRSWTGIRWPRRIRFLDPVGRPVEVQVRPPVDAAPFYLRHLVEGRCGDERGQGVAELVIPGRLDRAWMRPFVRMRVHRLAGQNSPFLPLFCGPVEGRLRRLWPARRAALEVQGG